ncbi:hypothetical protein DFA_08716 [Cavenderia fasciculata]|uniref:FUN14 family protein n=1 Tax=Cavenderia fasciculata TaxID=261658 RepID=F4Q3W2_CACFS|nr:uncharacterized protein DFA_08716 [Cavenderia fasciculata]EGG17718.1 hypothetical protein DFA_08716 [Cavenderia fasciculata]|eukprot:XP_004356202.1 hypothetical protein DFA_08716 [Cavenderia fasciculata]
MKAFRFISSSSPTLLKCSGINFKPIQTTTASTLLESSSYQNNNNNNNHNHSNNGSNQKRFFNFNSSSNSSKLIFTTTALSSLLVGGGSILCEEERKHHHHNLTRSKEELELMAAQESKRNNTITNLAGVTSLGTFVGYAAGYATKRLGKIVLFVVGFLFIFTQTLSYYGYLTVDWGRVTKDVSPKFSKEKRKQYLRSFINLLTQNLPFKLGFGGGFYLGLMSKMH